MNSVGDVGNTFSTRPRSGVVLLFILLSVVAAHVPLLNWLLTPISTFVTAVHEMSHAVACLFTGGHVAAMTIVNDGEGHGGLTYCQGGMPIVWMQAGYMGTALFGCLLIWLARMPKISKAVLMFMGLSFGAAALTFMFGTVIHGAFAQGLSSMFCALLLAGGLIWASMRLSWYWANLLLIFLGVQTGLNAVDTITWLFYPAGWSDASNMASLTGLPAGAWAVWWLAFAVITLGGTLFLTFKADDKRLNTI